MAEHTPRLIEGIDKAKAGEWDAAHAIAQSLEGHDHADWLHAILHKIEGDERNSRYWYGRTNQNYESYPDAEAELDALKAVLTY
ncbi:MAG: hypothetical protein ACR2PI_05670 [Hyphomicrobiaceae bacterium]